MQRLIKNFKQTVSQLWQERWNALAGGTLVTIVVLVVKWIGGVA